MRKVIVISVSLMCLGIAYYAFRIEPALLQVTQYAVSVPAEMQQAAGLKIAFLADFHAADNADGREDLMRCIQMANELKPDVILLGGDYMRTHSFEVPMDCTRMATYLAQLKAPLGVYAVLGNGDWRYGGEAVIDALRSVNIQVIENQAVVVGGRLTLVGITDHATGTSPDSANIKKTFAQLPVTNRCALVLTHSPRMFTQLPSSAFLVLVGHTHGYQVNVPFLWALISLVHPLEKHVSAYGALTQGSKQLIVTSGVGTGRVRVRFCARPEIVMITLK